MSNRTLSEEKKQTKLINANIITRHNAIVISCDEEMQISSFSLFKHYPINVNDVTIKIIKIQEFRKLRIGELISWILIILIVFGKCSNKLKLDICICSSQDTTIALCLVMTLALISFVCFFSSLSIRLLIFHLEYHSILL